MVGFLCGKDALVLGPGLLCQYAFYSCIGIGHLLACASFFVNTFEICEHIDYDWVSIRVAGS